MTSNPVDIVIQFALLQAGEEDDLFDQQLGPIHLIKYVYLADLHYARKHQGESFTGIDWRFYNFGPWSADVYERIAPALKAIGAEEKTFPSDYEDRKDWVRWRLRDETLLTRVRRELPSEITLALRREVHRFNKDTPGLLQYVYSTLPMLNAAPNERLDLSLVVEPERETNTVEFKPRLDALSNRKKRLFKESMAELRNKHAESVRTNTIRDARPPEYDDVFAQGVAWLDELGSAPKLAPLLEVEFDESVWKSQTRKGYDLP